MQDVQQMKPGLRVRTLSLGGTEGFLVADRYLTARKPGRLGTAMTFVPGHGGDVWTVRHDGKDDEDIAVYVFTELEIAE